MSHRPGKRNTPMSEQAAAHIELASRLALECLIKGGDKRNLYTLLQGFDVAHGLADDKAVIECGMQSLVQVAARAKETGVYRLEGDEVESACAAMRVYQRQLGSAKASAVIAVIREMNQRLKSDPLVLRKAA